jgi:SAM-dependent methyltransferase
LALHHDLERYSIDKHCFQSSEGEIYRKGWEWTHCLFGLRRLGMLQAGHHALGVGVGVGWECVIYYLANCITAVTATDLYGGAGWSQIQGKEADLALLEESKLHCPPGLDLSKITFENQDRTALSYPANSFDFAWSLSSIEHFGGHTSAQKAVSEMARVVRPGGDTSF